jgi:protein-S-isoprenylcysteine O-methyltransferase Ste14
VFDHVGFFVAIGTISLRAGVGIRTAADRGSHRISDHRKGSSMSTLGVILLIVLVLLLLGVLPTWGHSRSWGYGPSGGLGLLLVVVLVLVVVGRI